MFTMNSLSMLGFKVWIGRAMSVSKHRKMLLLLSFIIQQSFFIFVVEQWRSCLIMVVPNFWDVLCCVFSFLWLFFHGAWMPLVDWVHLALLQRLGDKWSKFQQAKHLSLGFCFVLWCCYRCKLMKRMFMI